MLGGITILANASSRHCGDDECNYKIPTKK